MANYRNRKLLDLAHRLQFCQMQILGYCEGFSGDGCEPAHSNQIRHGKGTGIKAHDWWHVAACRACHDVLDGRTPSSLTKSEKNEYFEHGWERTMDRYFREGWIGVTPEGKKR